MIDSTGETVMRPIGITGTREISNLTRSPAVEQSAEETTSSPAPRPIVPPSEPTEVPNLSSAQSFMSAVEQTETSWRNLLDGGKLPDHVKPVQWPDIPPRDPASGDVLQPLRSRLVETLSPALKELKQISDEIDGALEYGRPVDPERIRQGLEAIQSLKAGLSELVQASVSDGLRADPNRQPLVDNAFAEAAARAVGPLIAEDPARAAAAAANLEPSDVLSLVD